MKQIEEGRPALRAGTEWRGSAPRPGQFYTEGVPLRRLRSLFQKGTELVGEPLTLGQPSMGV